MEIHQGGACHHGSVPTLTDLARNLTSLSGPDLEWLHALVSDWQLLADLSFADLILWVPLRGPDDELGPGWVAVAQMRPTTGPTSFPDDVVGSQLAPGERPVLDTARVEHRIHRESDPDWTSGVPVRAEAIPVTRDGRVKEFLWTNPHSWFQLVVKDSSGKEVEWSIEGGSPNGLSRSGWKRTSLKPGDKAVAVIHPLKDGTNGGSLVTVSVNGVQIGGARS